MITETTKVQNKFAGMTALDLASVDTKSMNPADLAELNEAKAKAFDKIALKGVFTDPVSGQVFLSGEYIGTVKGACAASVLPKRWKLKKGENHLSDDAVDAGWADLKHAIVGAAKAGLCAVEGNGFSAMGQKAKTIRGLAETAVLVTSKMF